MNDARYLFLSAMILATALALILPAHAFAVTPQASSTPTKTFTPSPTISEEDVKESLRDRLKRAIDEKSDEAQQVLGQRERRAILGTLKDRTDSTLTVTTKSEETRFAATTENTTFVKKGKTVTASDAALGDYLIVMGYPGERDVLDARRVVITDGPTDRDTERVLRGTVAKVNQKLKIFELTAPRPAELGGPEILSVSLVKKSTLDVSEIADGDTVVVVGTQTDTHKPNLALLKFKVVNPLP